jgi:hypothetical protein
MPAAAPQSHRSIARLWAPSIARLWAPSIARLWAPSIARRLGALHRAQHGVLVE